MVKQLRASRGSEVPGCGGVAGAAAGVRPARRRVRPRSVPEDVSIARHCVGARHDGVVTDGHDGVVRLELPIESQYIRVARLVASGLGATAGLDVDAVDDLRIAVDELCAALFEVGGEKVELTFAVDADDVEVTGRTETRLGRPPSSRRGSCCRARSSTSPATPTPSPSTAATPVSPCARARTDRESRQRGDARTVPGVPPDRRTGACATSWSRSTAGSPSAAPAASSAGASPSTTSCRWPSSAC